MNRRSTTVLTIALFCLAGNAAAEDWKFSVTPYIWATDVGAKVSLDQRPVLDTRIGFTDLIKDLDMAAQVRFEAQRKKHGVFADLFTVHLSKDDSRIHLPTSTGTSGAAAGLDATINMTIVEAGGIFNPRGDTQGLSVLYGTRLISQKADIGLRVEGVPSQSHEAKDTFVDAMIGARFAGRASRRLGYVVRADVSSGGTELTWSGSAGLTYALGSSDKYVLVAGYRYLKVNFAADGAVEADMTLSGFATGFRMNF